MGHNMVLLNIVIGWVPQSVSPVSILVVRVRARKAEASTPAPRLRSARALIPAASIFRTALPWTWMAAIALASAGPTFVRG